MKTICLASNNQHKLQEINELYSDLDIEWKTLSHFPKLGEIIENGSTFEENALIKAESVYQFSKLPTIADDSGLEIDYLNGDPGIYSARFCGKNSTDALNNSKVLELLENVPLNNRTARFVCASVFVDSNIKIVKIGLIEGHISLTLKGAKGFGYDPLFIPDGYKQTFGQLGEKIKNRISHRAKAFLALKNDLFEYANDN